MSADDSSNGYEPIFVARQPIFDKNMRIWGYELLFRHSGELEEAAFDDPSIATSQVIMDGLSLAREGVPENKKMFINFPKELIMDGTPSVLPKGHVIELLEDIQPDPEIIEKCDELKGKYLLAVDDYTGQPEYDELLERAHIIKVDVLNMDVEDMAEIAQRLRPLKRVLLAEKVESQEIFEQAKKLGFLLFQGFFFSKPLVVSGRKLSTSQVSRLRLLQELEGKEYDPKSLSSVLKTDVSLSYRLLRYVNSPGIGLPRKINSVLHAINLLGERRIRQWLRILIMADLNPSDRGQEMVRLCAIRGRFLQSMAEKHGLDQAPETMFLIGLFSALDTILDQPMDTVLKELPLDTEIKETLLGEETDSSHWLEMVKGLQKADWNRLQKLAQKLCVDPEDAAHTYNEASSWSLELLQRSKASTEPS
jgi:EAL and modified HD-GYP domain-containing signal transduction protein